MLLTTHWGTSVYVWSVDDALQSIRHTGTPAQRFEVAIFNQQGSKEVSSQADSLIQTWPELRID
jgi:hypothetical protein